MSVLEYQVPVGDQSCKIFVDKVPLRRVELKSGRRNQLALGLMDILFEPDILALSTVNGSRDAKQPLDENIIEAIGSKYITQYVIYAMKHQSSCCHCHRSLL